MYRLYCRVYQFILRAVMYVLPWREPKLIQGKQTLFELPNMLHIEQVDRVLIVTDETIRRLDFFSKLIETLTSKQIKFELFDEVVPNPTISNIEQGRSLFIKANCQAIVAIGGGSVIDCAKGIAARIARPNKTIPQLKGQLKVLKKGPKLFAVPTTAGTGSEATVAAVISLSNKHKAEKFIDAIEHLNKNMNIPTTLHGIKVEDIPILVKRALAEANPLYPVPVIMTAEQMTHIFLSIRSEQ